ncbi:unnamed protein product [Enterobius vermicularis]|uniref:C-type lectin domain-containing protein n=1 Tax=Enterobius vermicularis TaxID=51028 RepID=A0A0N4VIQ3_ENTVE|nr:unnamed protein product [Enterobius vermicularis]
MQVSSKTTKEKYCIFSPIVANNVYIKDPDVGFFSDMKSDFVRSEKFCVAKFGGHLISIQDDEELAIANYAVFSNITVGNGLVAPIGFMASPYYKSKTFTDGTNLTFAMKLAVVRDKSQQTLCLYLYRHSTQHIDGLSFEVCHLSYMFVCKAEVPEFSEELLELLQDIKKAQSDTAPSRQYKVTGKCEKKEDQSIRYDIDPFAVSEKLNNETYCVHDLTILPGRKVRNFEEAEDLCVEIVDGHLISISNELEKDFLVQYLFADEQRIPNLDVDARIIGLRYESGRGTPNYTDGADGAYALYTAYTQSRTYDFHGNCFALSNFTENKTYTASILRASCDFQLGIDRVTCKSRAENVDMSAEITFKRVFHLEDEIRKYFGEDSVNFEHFLLFKSVYCRIQTAVNQT